MSLVKNSAKASGERTLSSGCCSACVRLLAVTTSAENGLGMGLATTFVLVCSNIVVSSCAQSDPAEAF